MSVAFGPKLLKVVFQYAFDRTKLGPPVERLDFSRGTLPPKKGERALLGDLETGSS